MEGKKGRERDKRRRSYHIMVMYQCVCQSAMVESTHAGSSVMNNDRTTCQRDYEIHCKETMRIKECSLPDCS